MILKLNEEQQGLKLIQVNDGFVIIDLNKDVEKDNYYWYNNSISRAYKNALMYNKNPRESFKIIYATPNLNLEGVPVIEEKDIENIKKASLQNNEFWRNGGDYDTFELGFIQGYKQAQQNLFTEEQVREAYFKGATDCHDKCTERNWKGVEQKVDIKKLEKLSNYFIQSLKQPKVEITFENNVPVKAVMI